MKEHVSLERAHEEQRGGARIADAQPSRGRGAAEIADQDGKAAARRAVTARVEGEDQRRALRVGVHGHDDVRADDGLGKGDEFLGDAAEDGARIGVAGRGGQVADAGGGLDDVRAAHGLGEELLLGADVAEEGGGGDVELAGDVGQGGGGEALGAEDATGGVDDLIAADARRASHL